MAKVKIYLEPNETQREAEDLLYKALDTQRTGEAHADQEKFDDPAMQSLCEQIEQQHNMIIEVILNEIMQVLNDSK